MIVVPTHYITTTEISPQSLELTVFSKDSIDITEKCNFEFLDTPPEWVKLVKNILNISKNVAKFSGKIKATYKTEECYMDFAIN